MLSTRYLSDDRVHRRWGVDNAWLNPSASGDTVHAEILDVHTQGRGSTGVIPGNRTEALA